MILIASKLIANLFDYSSDVFLCKVGTTYLNALSKNFNYKLISGILIWICVYNSPKSKLFTQLLMFSRGNFKNATIKKIRWKLCKWHIFLRMRRFLLTRNCKDALRSYILLNKMMKFVFYFKKTPTRSIDFNSRMINSYS